MFFEGDAATMLATFDRVQKMSPDTLLFPGHEYTASNLLFAQALEPESYHVADMLRWANHRRQHRLTTVPTTVEQERCFNPFFRADKGSGMGLFSSLFAFPFLLTPYLFCAYSFLLAVREGLRRLQPSLRAENLLTEVQTIAQTRVAKDSFKPSPSKPREQAE